MTESAPGERLARAIQRFRETGTEVKRIDDIFRKVYESDGEHFTQEVLVEHLTRTREYYVNAERWYNNIAHLDYNDPLMVEYREVLLERLRERDEVIGYWEKALRARLP